MTEATIIEQLAELRKTLKELETENYDLRQEMRELNEEVKESERAAAKAAEREDEWLRERAHLRQQVKRRQLDALEKAAHGIRIEAIKTLRSMLPAAKAQAKKGKPALLRLILRSTR
jgi:peptidoglycan hydrolase CwlO-like protein